MSHLTTRLTSKVLTFIWGPGEEPGGEAIILRWSFRSKDFSAEAGGWFYSLPPMHWGLEEEAGRNSSVFFLPVAAYSSIRWWSHFYWRLFFWLRFFLKMDGSLAWVNGWYLKENISSWCSWSGGSYSGIHGQLNDPQTPEMVTEFDECTHTYVPFSGEKVQGFQFIRKDTLISQSNQFLHYMCLQPLSKDWGQ